MAGLLFDRFVGLLRQPLGVEKLAGADVLSSSLGGSFSVLRRYFYSIAFHPMFATETESSRRRGGAIEKLVEMAISACVGNGGGREDPVNTPITSGGSILDYPSRRS
jgi:hypothetical protein